MLLHDKLLGESSYIGEELLTHYESAVERKCRAVKDSVIDGDFNLEDALKIYQVSKTDYEHFVAQSALQIIGISITGYYNSISNAATIEVLTAMVSQVGGPQATRTIRLIKKLRGRGKIFGLKQKVITIESSKQRKQFVTKHTTNSY